MKHALRAALQLLVCALVQLPMIILGWPLVAVGLLFRREYPDTKVPFSGALWANWMLIRLPSLLLPWDNIIDGMAGDKRGSWHRQTGNAYSFWSMWRWAALRNPANYFKRFILTCNVATCTSIEKLAGQDYVRDDFDHTGFQFLVATNKKGRRFYHLYLVRRWGSSDRALVVQLGFKFHLGDEKLVYVGDTYHKAYKGFTFEVNPLKNIN